MKKNFFTAMMIRHWNKLPRAEVESPSLQVFSESLDTARRAPVPLRRCRSVTGWICDLSALSPPKRRRDSVIPCPAAAGPAPLAERQRRGRAGPAAPQVTAAAPRLGGARGLLGPGLRALGRGMAAWARHPRLRSSGRRAGPAALLGLSGRSVCPCGSSCPWQSVGLCPQSLSGLQSFVVPSSAGTRVRRCAWAVCGEEQYEKALGKTKPPVIYYLLRACS